MRAADDLIAWRYLGFPSRHTNPQAHGYYKGLAVACPFIATDIAPCPPRRSLVDQRAEAIAGEADEWVIARGRML
jgi:hypothetical protein